MEIKSISKQRLVNLSHFQFHEQNVRDIAFEGSNKLGISTQFNKYLEALLELDILIKKIMKNPLTGPLKELDHTRDQRYSGIRHIVTGYLHHYSQEVSSAANNLNILFDGYGNINGLPYRQQTAATHNLLQDLKSNKYKNDVAMCRIKDLVDDLEMLHNQYKILWDERKMLDLEKPEGDVHEARLAIDKIYDEIVAVINVNVIQSGVADYKSYISQLNYNIDKTKQELEQTKKHKKGE